VAGKLAAERAQLASMQAEQNRLKKILKQRALEAKRRAAAAARAAAKKRQSSGGGGGGRASSGSGDGYLSAPTDAGYVSSEYGMRFHPLLHYWRLHSGRDYAAPCGTPIKAAANGTIIVAGSGGSYGNRVVTVRGPLTSIAARRARGTAHNDRGP
jgi:murein DD-endopeptidase MepM/ murein hydrolase activator NlpD